MMMNQLRKAIPIVAEYLTTLIFGIGIVCCIRLALMLFL